MSDRSVPSTATHSPLAALMWPIRPGETVGAPFVAAHAMMGEEQTFRIAAFLDRCQAIEIRSPIAVFPVRIEEIGFRDVGACTGRDLQQFGRGATDRLRVGARRRQIGLMAFDSRKRRRPAACDNDECKRVKHGRFVLLPITDQTRGHGTHSIPAIWKNYLAELLQESVKTNQ